MNLGLRSKNQGRRKDAVMCGKNRQWSVWAAREGLKEGGGWRDLGKGVGMKRENGDILGNHQATATANMNNVPFGICRAWRLL